MNIEIINIDKQETSLRLNNKDKNDLFAGEFSISFLTRNNQKINNQ